MKNKYLREIKEKLLAYEITTTELNDILSDYDQMFDDGLEKGLSDQEVIDFLGNPEKVVRELSESYILKSENKHRYSNKIVALMPFLTTVTYVILGLYFDLWHPMWLIFLLIPVVAIISNARTNIIQTLTALSPFIATVTFILLGTYLNAWNPAWLVFLIIPVLGVLNSKDFWKSFGFIVTILMACFIYLYAGYAYNAWGQGALAFFLPFAYGILTNDIKVSFGKGLLVKITVVLSLIIYFVFGFFFNTWGYLWMIFLAIPMVSIIRYSGKNARLVALMPFISTIIFFCLGYFFGLWAISWIAFLLIPVVAIIKNA
ncbi:MAG: DUF1700 domain-containing protein [Candidatus Izemoplasmatales bacterium]|nr:DUF1700 domain-containing protein [Candidatus Izemoplasmatales bacterium]